MCPSGEGRGRTSHEVPVERTRPMTAYVERIRPTQFNGVRLQRKLEPVRGRHSKEEIIYEIASDNGGGYYRVRCYDQMYKRRYLGTFYVQLPHSPLIDGEHIEPEHC